MLGYLQDFLFTPERARAPVTRLSGGERNRLLLAQLFAQPSNLLVLDEPTNDLDIETLELLEELLVDYTGTLLLVSHDRDFLDNVVTTTLVIEGDGRVGEYVGGYSDWLRQRARPASGAAPRGQGMPAAASLPEPPQPRRKLSYKVERELEQLPLRIEALEGKHRRDDAGDERACVLSARPQRHRGAQPSAERGANRTRRGVCALVGAGGRAVARASERRAFAKKESRRDSADERPKAKP